MTTSKYEFTERGADENPEQLDELVAAAGEHMVEPQDWIDMAMACIDQAGLPLREQHEVAQVLERLGWEALALQPPKVA